MFFPALLTKLLSAGAVAQAATGATVVVVAVAGARAVGVLPGPVQDTFTSIVSDEAEAETVVVEDPLTEAPLGEAPVVEEPVTEATAADAELPEDAAEWAAEGPAGFPSFGAWVSFGSEHGYTTGAVVSCWAHARNDERQGREADTSCAPEAEAPAEDGTGVEDGTVVEEAPEADASEDEVEENSDDRGNRGNGNGRGNGGNGNGNGRN